MRLTEVDIVNQISPEDFKKKYYLTKKPLIIKGFSTRKSQPIKN